MTSTVALPEAPFGGLAPTVTLHDVELCRVGQWNASTGGIDITPAVLEQLAAASRDPDADHVPVHAGHVDPRFPALSDGEPAMGWVQNVRVVGDRLVGDLADVPAKLAALIPKAYRRRSIEIAQNVTHGARSYPLALHGLGLLGVEMPAVKGLADVVARYSTSPATEGTTLLLSDESNPPPKERPVPPTTSRIPDDRLRALMGLAADADVSRLQSELVTTYEAGDGAPQGAAGAPAAPLPVPAQATAPAAPAAAQAAPAGASVPGANVPTGELVNASAAQAVVAGVPAHQGAAAVSPVDGQVSLSAAQWEGIQGLIRSQAEQRVETTLAAALSSGRIAPAEADGWRQHLVADEARTGALLNLLPANRVPVGELGSVGHANLSAHTAAGEAAMLGFEASLGLDLPGRVPAPVATQTQGA